MPSHKILRANEDIRRELYDIIRGMKDPRITGMLSIVKVDLSGDYSVCKVYVSSLEGMEATRQAVEGLKSGAGHIRREINERLNFRRSPEFTFLADDSIEKSADLSQKLNELLKDRD